MSRDLGLLWFLIVYVGTGLALLVDLGWMLHCHETISQYCRCHPWAAGLLFSYLVSGAIGLAVHLWAPA
jgi:hypothetical protein